MTFGGVEYMVGVTSRGSLDPQGQEYPCGPDAEEIEQRAKACEQTSAAFAEIAPRVMLVEKK